MADYGDLRNPYALGGITRVRQHKKLSDLAARRYLAQDESYVALRPQRRGLRIPYFVYTLRAHLQMDLMETRPLAKQNGGTNYILTVVDVFSKFAWAEPLTSKQKQPVLEGFRNIFNRIPGRQQIKSLGSDAGAEFSNTLFRRFLQQHGIQHQIMITLGHAPFIERFNKTLKGLLYRYMHRHQTHRFLEVLPELMRLYNYRGHRMFDYKLSPFLAEKPKNHVWVRYFTEAKLIRHLYQTKSLRKRAPRFAVGDTVRIVKHRTPFHRSFQEQLVIERFIVAKVIRRFPVPLYEIKDLHGDPIVGRFYAWEMAQDEGDSFRIERILRTERRRNQPTRYFVKWLGYSNAYNSWISERDIQQFRGH